MSVESRETLEALVHNAKNGNEAAAKLLREIGQMAFEKAPIEDLVFLGECLIRMNRDIDRRNAESN